jgi:hydrogenase maturation protease
MNKKRQAAKLFSVHSISPSSDVGACSSDHPITRSPDRLLVVGCGGPFAADDNVGLEIVHRLRAGDECGCEFLELAGGALGLLDFFNKAKIILFVDAVQSGAPAGTVHLLPLPSREIVPRAMGRVSSHGWGLEETLRLSRSLGLRLPRLMLLGVELESVTTGSPRTRPVEAALGAVVECFPKLLEALRDNDSPAWSGYHSYPPGDRVFLNLTVSDSKSQVVAEPMDKSCDLTQIKGGKFYSASKGCRLIGRS